jgi:membrane protein YqaA with SNARE-associated domain
MRATESLIRRVLFVLLLAVFVGLVILLLFFNPGEVIQSIGIRNSLIIAFFLSMAGAFTSLTTISSYPLIISLVAGQMSPVVVGLVTGIGMAAGDILFFAFGYSARDWAGKRWQASLERFLELVKRMRQIFVQGLIFLYVAATPFPNNLLSGALAFIGYPLRKAWLPIVLGDIAFCLFIAWLASRGIRVM